MKNRLIYILVIVVLLFSSSSGLSAEEYAQNEEAKILPLSPAFLKWREEQQQEQNFKLQLDKSSGVSYQTGYIPSPVDLSHLANNPPIEPVVSGRRRAPSTLPSKYDLREGNYLTAIRNQNPYGTCWAFAAIGAMESNYLMQGNSALDLSEMHLAWFAYKNSDSSKTFFNLNSSSNIATILNNGGNAFIATATYSRLDGPVLESELPYPSQPSSSSPTAYSRALRLRDVYYLNATADSDAADTSENIKKRIMEHGAVQISYYAGNGAYSPESSVYTYFDNTHGTDTNHAVLIVGWDDDFSKNNFSSRKPASDGAWLVRNSWGSSWGDEGYFWMSYEQYIEDGAAFVVEEVDSDMKCYDYDALGWLGIRKYSGSQAYALNIFKSERNEKLVEVGFYTPDNNVNYEIKIYTGLSSLTSYPNVNSATAAATQSGSIPFAGYHTVTLSNPVDITQNQFFAVVLNFKNTGMIPIEMKVDNYTPHVKIEDGSATSYDGTNWAKGSTLNTCIKAFTVSSGTSALIAPTITTSGTLPQATRDVYYSQTLSATGTKPITWELSSGSLPEGLSLAGSGTISGTPTTTGDFTFTAKASNYTGSDIKIFTLKVSNPTSSTRPTITTNATLPRGKVGVTYYKVLSASGTKPITWKISKNSLPSGLSLSEDGTISGTPTSSGTFYFHVTATNSAGSSDGLFDITIDEGTLTVSAKPEIRIAEYNNIESLSGTTITVNAGQPFSVLFDASVVYGRIELDFDNQTELKNNYALTLAAQPYNGSGTAYASLSGTPLIASKGVKFKLSASNEKGTTTKTYTLKINADTPAFADINIDGDGNSVAVPTKAIAINEIIDDIIVKLKSSGPIVWSASNLPAGLKLIADTSDSTTAYITGAPQKEGIYKYTITAKNTVSNKSITARGTLTVQSSPAFTSNNTTLAAASLGGSYSQTFSITGLGSEITSFGINPPSYQDNGKTVWTSSDISVSLNPSTLKITISSSRIKYYPPDGEYNITIRIANKIDDAEETFTIPVTAAAPKITTTTLKAGRAGSTYESKIVASGALPIRWSASISDKSLAELSKAGLDDIESINDIGLSLGTITEDIKKGTSTVSLKSVSSTSLKYALKDLEIVINAENAATDISDNPTSATLKLAVNGTKPSFVIKKDTTITAMAGDSFYITAGSDDLNIKGSGPLTVTASGQGDIEIDTENFYFDSDGVWKGITVAGEMPDKKTTVTFTVTNPFTKATATKKLIFDAQTPIEINDPGLLTATVGSKFSTALKASGAVSAWSIDDNAGSDNLTAAQLKDYGIQIAKKTGILSSSKIIVGTKTTNTYRETLNFVVKAENSATGDSDSLEVSINLNTVAPKVTVAKAVTGTLGQPYNKGKGITITVTGTPAFKYDFDNLPAGLQVVPVAGKTNAAIITGTPTSLTLKNNKVAAQAGTITVTDPAYNEGTANVSIIVRDQTPKFKKSSITLNGSLAAGETADVDLRFLSGTGYYQWTAKGSGATAVFNDADALDVSEAASLTITAPAKISKTATATITVTATNIYDSTIKATMVLKVKVTTGEGSDVGIKSGDVATEDEFKAAGPGNDGFNTDLDLDTALKPEESNSTKAKISFETVETIPNIAAETSLTLGREREASSLEAHEKNALEGYLIAAILPEITVTSDGQYDLEVDLAEEIPAGMELFWFAFPRNSEPDDDDEIIEFADISGTPIKTVPNDHIVIVSPWLDAEVIYAPVIAVKADGITEKTE